MNKTREPLTSATYFDDLGHEVAHVRIVAELLDDAANGRDSFADGPFNISAVRKHAAWLHRVVVEFQEMFGHMPDPLFGGELLEVFNTVKDSPALQAITCGLSPPRLRTNSGGGRR